MRAIALIDGEHYPAVVNDYLQELGHEVVGLVLVGGGEKLREDVVYQAPLYPTVAEALAASDAPLVLDLSDEPVLEPARRFRLASEVLATGRVYQGADFRLAPVFFHDVPYPALAVIGSGKRVGKTAVAGHIARLLAARHEIAVVAMGRGGPREPELVTVAPALEDLLARSRAGQHAASDYLEDAALAGVVTLGARRLGGGLAGQPFKSNVAVAALKARELGAELVLFEGSGACVPPVACGARVLVAAADRPDLLLDYLGPYRILIADLVVLTRAEAPFVSTKDVARLVKAIKQVKDVPVVQVVLRPKPSVDVAGQRVAVFTTAPPKAARRLSAYFQEELGVEGISLSCQLADRAQLAVDLKALAGTPLDAYLTEIKAAAIDMVAEAAEQVGVPLHFLDNEVVSVKGDLNGEIERLAARVLSEQS